MNSRFVRISALAVAALTLAACGAKIVFNKAAYDSVKKVAIVHYALNPSTLLGASNAGDVQKAVADANLKTVVEKLTGLGYEIVPLADMQANPEYQKFAAEQSGFVAPTGMRLPAESKAWEQSALPAPTAAALATALGVDAVVVVSENWRTYNRGGFGGFVRVAFNSGVFVQMIDKAGVQVWADAASEGSNEGLASVGGILTSPDGVQQNATESVSASLDKIRERLANARDAK
jgi:hypothetical protein